MRRLILLFAALCVFTLRLYSQAPDKSAHHQFQKGTAGLTWQVLNINNLRTWHRSDGEGNHSPGGDEGLGYPLFTARCVYEDNLVFGGIMYVGNWPENGGTKAALQAIRVNGGTYLSNHGMLQGWVESSGANANYQNSMNDPRTRIFRIRRDYMEMTDDELRRDAAISFETFETTVSQAMMDAIKEQYKKDWAEWPVEYGAPFIDRNGNGVYDLAPSFSSSFTVDSLTTGNYDEPGIAPAPHYTPADQLLYTVYHCLDRSKTLVTFGSEPIGLEVQKTVWGYKSGTELPDHYFVRYRFINKGGVTTAGTTKGSFYIDSLFIGQWSDIDLGNAGDDLLGCDTVLHLGYSYNANEIDQSYDAFGLPPPSVGYTILGGPLVPAPSDSGLYDFQRVYGKKNLMMTSFASHPTWDNWGIYDEDTGKWWFMLRGYAPVGRIHDQPTPYPHPPGYAISRFPFSGDPVTGSGFLDGLGTDYSPSPGDRRMLVSSGPSRLAQGDTAELVVGVVVGLGADRISSAAVMKANTATARRVFESSFDLARPPEKPALTATALNGEVILDWGANAEKIERVEKTIIAGDYLFEGYNVYQLPAGTASLSEGVKLATFDVTNGVTNIKSYILDPVTGFLVAAIVQEGSDSGIQRYLRVTRDLLRDSPDRLYNGREYFFGVTAYNHSGDPDKKIRSLESDPSIISIVPQIPYGVQISTRTGDTVTVTKSAGNANTLVSAIVYDPLKATGHTYEMRFDTIGANRAIVHDLSIDSDVYTAAVIANEPLVANIDGIQVTLVDEGTDFKQFLVIANALGFLDPPEIGALAFTLTGFPLYNGFDRPNGSRQQSTGLNASQGWSIHASNPLGDYRFSSFKNIITSADSTWNLILGNDFEIRFTAAGGQAQNQATGSMLAVPFELWNVGGDSASSTDDYRMIPVILDANANNLFDYDSLDHTISGGDDDPETDQIFWYNPSDRSPGEAGYDAWVSSGGTSGAGDLVMAHMVLVLWNGGNVTDPTFPANVSQQLPETGTIFRIIAAKPAGPSDRFTFTAPGVQSGLAIMKAGANRVGVYPNPYFAGWSYEDQPLQQHVTFNNLPEQVRIRIFNLAGHLVRTLVKNNSSQFLRWDLTNEHNWQIGSGIYICHVEMPDIGETKIIKLAVVLSEAPPTY